MTTYVLKSIGAVLLALIVVGVLSHATDFVLEQTGFMKLPFSDNPLWLMFFVTFYRTVYVVVGGYVAAWLAPSKPMRLVTIYACIGFLLGTAGAVAMWHEPPHWYPVALILLGVPAAWLGGKLRVSRETAVSC